MSKSKASTDYETYDDPFATVYYPATAESQLGETDSTQRNAMLDQALSSRFSPILYFFAFFGLINILWVCYKHVKTYKIETYQQVEDMRDLQEEI